MKDTCCDITKKSSFVPFIIAMTIVVVYTIVHQLILGHWSGMIAMNDFMGVWFLLFGVIKLFALEWFAHNFRKYDLIAHHAKRYGYAFPFLEIVLWAAYLVDFNMVYRIPINVFTALLMGITAVWVAHALHHKKDVLCVCMGIHFPLPMSKVTLIENVAMGAMAVGMLFWMTGMSASWNYTQDTHTPTSAVETSAQCH
jgi:hypothetical protein